MKKYETPEVDILLLGLLDVVLTSGGGTTPPVYDDDENDLDPDWTKLY